MQVIQAEIQTCVRALSHTHCFIIRKILEEIRGKSQLGFGHFIVAEINSNIFYSYGSSSK